MIDIKLKDWASTRQADYIDAVNEHGSYRKAAQALGVHHDRVRKSLQTLRKRAAVQGYAPEHDLTHPIPEPFIAKGHSSLRAYRDDPSGKLVLQWEKTKLDEQQYQALLREAIREFVQDQPRVFAPKLVAKDVETDVIPWLQIGDAHIGMLAHEAETGQNFDLKIAERELCTAIVMLLERLGSQTFERIVINDLGDGTHYENFKQETERSGHRLDGDGRFPKMIRVYSRVMRFIVDACLQRAKHVDVLINRGNHSETNDVWMTELLQVAYGHTGRVHVLNNDSVFNAYRMGNTLVMVHHGHTCKADKLVQVMTNDFRRDYGETEFHYIDMGHIHHRMAAKEHGAITVESWNNLAPNDRHAHDGGWRSKQSITAVLRSRSYGEVGRQVLPIQQVRDRIFAAHDNLYKPLDKVAFRA